jgi:uncharacterized membrane protein
VLSIWTRFLLYGAFGCCLEVFFTGIKQLARSRFRDWSLQGRTFIWMFPIYGLAAFLFEPLHDALRSVIWPLRGLIYTAGVYMVEYASGFLLKQITGRCPWDYSGRARFHFHGFVRWDYAPFWFALGLVLERFHDLLLRVHIVT